MKNVLRRGTVWQTFARKRKKIAIFLHFQRKHTQQINDFSFSSASFFPPGVVILLPPAAAQQCDAGRVPHREMRGKWPFNQNTVAVVVAAL